SGELRSILEDEYQSYIVDVCEQLRDGWTALHRLGLQPALRKSAEQVDQNGVVPVPGIQQSLQQRLRQALVWCVRHIHTRLCLGLRWPYKLCIDLQRVVESLNRKDKYHYGLLQDCLFGACRRRVSVDFQ